MFLKNNLGDILGLGSLPLMFTICNWNNNSRKPEPRKLFAKCDIFIIRVRRLTGSIFHTQTLPVDGDVSPPYTTVSGDKHVHNM